MLNYFTALFLHVPNRSACTIYLRHRARHSFIDDRGKNGARENAISFPEEIVLASSSFRILIKGERETQVTGHEARSRDRGKQKEEKRSHCPTEILELHERNNQ
ncbi:hypothetical protein P5673_015243 [Acropora cervicornis]|uniref:Uncharacterized protein n=1 Tax=Acropora cervicornis TaxID=6130 RepID=A0AAD9QIF9_ACRCE|nr:hypothetical protein P5673_015243 [Acropora cervicornis]